MFRRRLTVRLASNVPPVSAEGIDRLDVVYNPDGTLTVTADPVTLARLGGRRNFGSGVPVQELLLDRIADAWHAAKCPPDVQMESARMDPRGLGDGLGTN